MYAYRTIRNRKGPGVEVPTVLVGGIGQNPGLYGICNYPSVHIHGEVVCAAGICRGVRQAVYVPPPNRGSSGKVLIVRNHKFLPASVKVENLRDDPVVGGFNLLLNLLRHITDGSLDFRFGRGSGHIVVELTIAVALKSLLEAAVEGGNNALNIGIICVAACYNLHNIAMLDCRVTSPLYRHRSEGESVYVVVEQGCSCGIKVGVLADYASSAANRHRVIFRPCYNGIEGEGGAICQTAKIDG